MPENSQNKDNIAKAFEPDYLNRKALAVEWTDALLSTKINHHLVISVSGDWGTGKTYLAKNWYKYLEEQGYFTCYIDAHKKDYAEDPLLIIMNEIENHVNEYMKEENGAIKDAFDKVKDSFLPFLASGLKTAGKVGASIVLPDMISSGVKQIIDEVDAETIKEFVKSSIEKYGKKKDNYIKQYYNNIQAYSKNMEEFKRELEKFAAQFNKPVVIFIDELDRSNPKFVIKLIEQLKHIFEIPNLAFILTVNKKELSNTIKGIYGSEMDGYAYYKKFTTHDFTLYPIEQIDEILINEFIKYTTNKYNEYNLSHDFIGMASSLSKRLNLFLRDIEQILDHIYYIKEKVTREYHKEYLIICFFYRAVYVKDYHLLTTYRREFELIYNNEIKLKENNNSNISIINNLLEDIRKNFYVQYNLFTLMSIIITGVNVTNIQEVKKLCPINLHPFLSNGLQELDTELQYIYYPIFTDKKLLFKGARLYNDEKILEKIYNIRKNLIQLSILGAKPEKIVFRQVEV